MPLPSRGRGAAPARRYPTAPPMTGSRRFDEIAEELARAVAGSPDAAEAAAELRRLAEEIEALTADDPFPAGVADGTRRGPAPRPRRRGRRTQPRGPAGLPRGPRTRAGGLPPPSRRRGRGSPRALTGGAARPARKSETAVSRALRPRLPEQPQGDIVRRLARGVVRRAGAKAVAAELRQLAGEIASVGAGDPFASETTGAGRAADEEGSVGRSLTGLAADLLHDHAGDRQLTKADLLDYLQGLGGGQARFLARVADAIDARRRRALRAPDRRRPIPRRLARRSSGG